MQIICVRSSARRSMTYSGWGSLLFKRPIISQEDKNVVALQEPLIVNTLDSTTGI